MSTAQDLPEDAITVLATHKTPFTFPQNEFFKELEALTLRYFENGLPVAQIITALRLEIGALQEIPRAALKQD